MAVLLEYIYLFFFLYHRNIGTVSFQFIAKNFDINLLSFGCFKVAGIVVFISRKTTGPMYFPANFRAHIYIVYSKDNLTV